MAKKRRPTARAAAKKTTGRAKRPATKKSPARRKATAKKTATKSKLGTKRPAGRKTATKKKKKTAAPARRKTASKAARAPARRKTTAKASKKRSTAGRPRSRRKAPAPVVKIREAYAKAVALYEKGLKALQRKHYATAAGIFRQVLQVPEERELHERARLYLNVCERESGPKAKVPRTVDDRIFAATLALNRRDFDEALMLLRSAAASRPTDDHVQYMLALALASTDDAEATAAHLKKAIALNPDNRLQAEQEADFESFRDSAPYLDAVKTS